MVLTYLLEVNSGEYNPSDDDVLHAPEKVAAYMIFQFTRVWSVPPTVKKECRAIGEYIKRENHDSFMGVMFEDILELNEDDVNVKANSYHEHHPGLSDCYIVAEAELGEINVLLTFDEKLMKNLGGCTGALELMAPSQYWAELNIERGTPPLIKPHPTHPLQNSNWWRWV